MVGCRTYSPSNSRRQPISRNSSAVDIHVNNPCERRETSVKWKSIGKRLVALVSVLVVALGFSGVPGASAVAGDAQVDFWNLSQTPDYLMCTATTNHNPSNCGHQQVLDGQRYFIAGYEDTGLLAKQIHVYLGDADAGSFDTWENIAGSRTATGGTPTCVLTTTVTIEYKCWAPTAIINSAWIAADATSFSSCDLCWVGVDSGSGLNQVWFSHRQKATEITVKTCAGVTVNKSFGQFNLSSNTCYDVTFSRIYAHAFDELRASVDGFGDPVFSSTSWSSAYTGSATCGTNGSALAWKCTGSANSRNVTSVTFRGTSGSGGCCPQTYPFAVYWCQVASPAQCSDATL